jgi:hypothetical protein
MRRTAVVFALLVAAALPASASADAQGLLPPGSVTLQSPSGGVSNPWVFFHSTITGTTLPGNPQNLTVSYVRFWIDVPQAQRDNPQPYGGCVGTPSTCQFMGSDRDAETATPGAVSYSLANKYNGPRGRHVGTVQAWRDTSFDLAPVFMGQASNDFCLQGCRGG